MRAAGPASLAAAAVCACAVLFSGGYDDTRLVWIGGLALLLAASLAAAVLLGPLPAPALGKPGTAFLGALAGLAVWAGLSTLWSASPERSWLFTNRTLVYAAFALAGALAGPLVSRAALARAAAGLLALAFGWALLAKCVPALYGDYGRIARLRSPVVYWNELALLGAVAVPLGLWLASSRTRGPRARGAGVVLLFAAVLVTALTVSRFGIALACLAAAAWVLLDRARAESLAALALGGGVAAGVFGIALALPGITSDGEPRPVRAHDGWVFALVVLAATALVFVVAAQLAAVESRRPLAAIRRRRIERAAGLAALAVALAGLAVSIVFAHRIWSEFTNPVSAQVSFGPQRLGSFNSSNRWRWWTEAWHAFIRHPAGGTGAGTFKVTDLLAHRSALTTDEPHNVPLQLLSELGIVGFLLFLGAAVAATVGIVRLRARAAGDERGAVTALGVALAAFAAHTVVDFDWNFVATCAPLLFLAGALVAAPRGAPERAPTRRVLAAAGAVLLAAVGVYSLASPWLAQRQIAAADVAAAASLPRAISDLKQAHSLDPLSVEALTDRADFEDLAGDPRAARDLYRQALALEPQNTSTWYDYGVFWWNHRDPKAAYVALNNSYTYDPFGKASTHCGYLDFARHAVFGKGGGGPNCRGSQPAGPP
ncbi:MAG: O-antigen ligase family protein [Gaiellaceae bacterium]